MGTCTDLTGMRFGKLVVLERVENQGKYSAWLCQCDCGEKKVVRGGNLKSGQVKSCGCLARGPKEDLTGKRFGRLVVVGLHGHHKKRLEWECKCDCGKTCYVATLYLNNGDTKSCGCLHDDSIRERATTHGLSRVGKRDPRYIELYVIHTRCYNTNAPNYKHYGGRGIGVDYVWNLKENPDALNNWIKWCDESGFRKGLTCERIDVNKGYCPENSTWVPIGQQAWNLRRSVRLKNGRTVISVLVSLGLLSKSSDDINLYHRCLYSVKEHGELPQEIVELAKSQNKLFLLED